MYRAHRVLPSDDAAAHLGYVWFVRWEREEPFTQQVVTLPAAHFVFEQDDRSGQRTSRFAGPGRKRFERVLSGAGHIVGLALRAGTASAWVKQPMARFVDRVVPLRSVWRRDVEGAERAILGAASDSAARAAAEEWVRRWRPVLDRDSLLAARLVEQVSRDRSLCRVEALVRSSGLAERSLQRLFHRCVGLSPKAVIRRIRLVEAAGALEARSAGSLAELALQLGYFDQAHFIRDFKSVVGVPPRTHRHRAALDEPVRVSRRR
jgi:AraC-like DNA-binding protein